MFIFISGISGTGKTTLGKALVQRLSRKTKTTKIKWIFKDQDDFFRIVKPKVQLSDGSVKSNWDCKEALDLAKLNKWIKENIEKNVVFVGFALKNDWIKISPDIHFHLVFPDSKTKEYCIQSRKLSKNYTEDQINRDKLMVNEVVFPFYQKYKETLKSNKTKKIIFIDVYEEKIRKSVDSLIIELNTDIFYIYQNNERQ